MLSRYLLSKTYTSWIDICSYLTTVVLVWITLVKDFYDFDFIQVVKNQCISGCIYISNKYINQSLRRVYFDPSNSYDIYYDIVQGERETNKNAVVVWSRCVDKKRR